MSDQQTERRFTGMLLAMIGDISNALGISEEDQACANGAMEIIAAIEELKSAAARLSVERAEFRLEVDLLRAKQATIAAEYLESKRVIDAGPARVTGGFGPPRSWRHGDPEVIRYHSAVAALNALAASVKETTP